MLAEGGMANVYLAVTKGQANFEKLVVIKELRDELASDPTFVAMFMDEARLAARLNHPNVVQTYEVGSDGDRHFIAMEHLEGVTYTRLARVRDRVPPPLAIHVRVLCDVLYGLHYAHELRDFDGKPLAVVHRDVSPQNVMLSFAGGVKVLDFGIAKAALAVEQRPDDFKGKLEYMAPEQALREEVDRRADVFSVGIMLWEAVARQRLYVRGEDKYARLVSGELPDVLAARPDAPRRLAQICARALARGREHRYPTAQDMALELEEWLDGTTQHVRARDVGAYVAEKFAATRAKLSAAIEAQLTLVRGLPADGPESSIPLSRIPVTDVPPGDASEPPPPFEVPAAPPMRAFAKTLPLVDAPSPPGAPARSPSGAPPGAPAGSPWPSSPPPPPPSPSPSSSRASASASAVPTTAVAAAASGAPSDARRATSLFVLAGIGFAGILVTGGVLAMHRQSSRTASAATAAIPSAATPAAPGAPGIAPVTEIDFTIRASPPGARILVDGQPEAGNPAVGRRPRDGAVHVVRVEAPGFEPREEQITFDRSLLVTMDLRPSAPSGAALAASGASPTPSTSAASATSATAASPDAHASPAPTTRPRAPAPRWTPPSRGPAAAPRPAPPRSTTPTPKAGALDTENPYR
jgi:serine/threonine-protein kinase